MTDSPEVQVAADREDPEWSFVRDRYSSWQDAARTVGAAIANHADAAAEIHSNQAPHVSHLMTLASELAWRIIDHADQDGADRGDVWDMLLRIQAVLHGARHMPECHWSQKVIFDWLYRQIDVAVDMFDLRGLPDETGEESIHA